MKSNFIITTLISAIVSSLIGFALQKGLEKITNKNDRI